MPVSAVKRLRQRGRLQDTDTYTREEAVWRVTYSGPMTKQDIISDAQGFPGGPPLAGGLNPSGQPARYFDCEKASSTLAYIRVIWTDESFFSGGTNFLERTSGSEEGFIDFALPVWYRIDSIWRRRDFNFRRATLTEWYEFPFGEGNLALFNDIKRLYFGKIRQFGNHGTPGTGSFWMQYVGGPAYRVSGQATYRGRVAFQTVGRVPEYVGSTGTPGELYNEVTIPLLNPLEEYKVQEPTTAGGSPTIGITPREDHYETFGGTDDRFNPWAGFGLVLP